MTHIIQVALGVALGFALWTGVLTVVERFQTWRAERTVNRAHRRARALR